jgi:hypothetical protein
MATSKKRPLEAIYYNMRSRCESPNNVSYANYGGRGITISPEFHSFQAFTAWINENLGERPPGYTLDRINNDGNYEPGNLRWANHYQQMVNRRRRSAKKGVQCTMTGVTYDIKGRKRPYKAQIKVKGKNKHLGYFPYEVAAAVRYDREAKYLNEHTGTTYVLNFKWESE